MFITHSQLVIFFFSILTLALIPGNDVLYIASQTLHSKRHGFLAAMGTSTGATLYILATTFGLTALLQHSPWAFETIKIIGAAYLLYLAWMSFTSKESRIHVTADRRSAAFASYYKGIATNLLNPKVGLFFLAFLPQFINLHYGHLTRQFLLLGGAFVSVGTITNCWYVYLFSYFKNKLFQKPSAQKWLNKIIGTIFCILAISVLFF